MEKYIRKINDKLLKKNDLAHAQKVKTRYRAIGGTILGVGLAGIIACMTAFVVYFLRSETENSFLAWELAIPFVLIFIAGCVVARIGDQLLKGVDLKGADKEEAKSEEVPEKKPEEKQEDAKLKTTKKKSAKKKEEQKSKS